MESTCAPRAAITRTKHPLRVRTTTLGARLGARGSAPGKRDDDYTPVGRRRGGSHALHSDLDGGRRRANRAIRTRADRRADGWQSKVENPRGKTSEPVDHAAQLARWRILRIAGKTTGISQSSRGGAALAFGTERKRGNADHFRETAYATARCCAAGRNAQHAVRAAGEAPKELAAWISPLISSRLLALMLTKSRGSRSAPPANTVCSRRAAGLFRASARSGTTVRVNRRPVLDLGAVRLGTDDHARAVASEHADGSPAAESTSRRSGARATARTIRRSHGRRRGASNRLEVIAAAWSGPDGVGPGTAAERDHGSPIGKPSSIYAAATKQFQSGAHTTGSGAAGTWFGVSVEQLPRSARATRLPMVGSNSTPASQYQPLKQQGTLNSNSETLDDARERDLGVTGPTVIATSAGTCRGPSRMARTRALHQTVRPARQVGAPIEFWGYW